MSLDESQRGVMRGMMAALAASLVALAAAIALHPAFLTPPALLPERLAAAMRWDGLVLACLVLATGNLARHRFFTPADIDGSGLTPGSDRARIFQSVLQNTLEQAVLAVLAHLLWAATMPPNWFAAVPVAAVLFVVGRICFAAGYARGAAARAFGFALTFYPTVILTVIALAALVARAFGG